MKQKIDYLENRDNFLGWVIIHSLSRNQDKFDEISKAEGFDAKNLTIEFKINGVYLPFTETINDIEKQLDDMIAKEAGKQIKEKCSKLSSYIERLEKELRKSMKKELGIELSDEDF